MAKYYETEIPDAVVTDSGEFRYYKEAKKLQLSMPKFKSLDGEIHHGKTVTLPIDKFNGNEELKVLLNLVLADIE